MFLATLYFWTIHKFILAEILTSKLRISVHLYQSFLILLQDFLPVLPLFSPTDDLLGLVLSPGGADSLVKVEVLLLTEAGGAPVGGQAYLLTEVTVPALFSEELHL